jgi:hypothetical protein
MRERGGSRQHGKTRAATDLRSHLDSVSKQIGDPLDDEKADAKTVGSRRIEAVKSLEYSGELVGGYADSCVDHLDACFRTTTTTTDQNPSARRRVFQGVADEIAQHHGRSVWSLCTIFVVLQTRNVMHLARCTWRAQLRRSRRRASKRSARAGRRQARSTPPARAGAACRSDCRTGRAAARGRCLPAAEIPVRHRRRSVARAVCAPPKDLQGLAQVIALPSRAAR